MQACAGTIVATGEVCRLPALRAYCRFARCRPWAGFLRNYVPRQAHSGDEPIWTAWNGFIGHNCTKRRVTYFACCAFGVHCDASF